MASESLVCVWGPGAANQGISGPFGHLAASAVDAAQARRSGVGVICGSLMAPPHQRCAGPPCVFLYSMRINSCQVEGCRGNSRTTNSINNGTKAVRTDRRACSGSPRPQSCCPGRPCLSPTTDDTSHKVGPSLTKKQGLSFERAVLELGTTSEFTDPKLLADP